MDISLSNQLLVKALFSIGTIIITGGLVKLFFRRRAEQTRRAYPKDVVILHQFPRNKKVPSTSPFALKLETW
jgi:hypothetical protein